MAKCGWDLGNPAARIPADMNTKREELFDGGELPVMDGRVTIPSEPGIMKLYLIRDSEIKEGEV
jgi:hypothetical protein